MNRLIIVSNRLPFALDSTGEDLWTMLERGWNHIRFTG